MTTETPQKPTRIPYYNEETYQHFKSDIADALNGETHEYRVKGSGHTESSLFTMLRSTLRYAEREKGIEGASSLKVYKSGSAKDRVLTLRKLRFPSATKVESNA